MTTPSIKNYLKAIRELRDETGRVTTCALARHLALAPASITHMAQRLAAAGFLEYTPYRGMSLTEAGEQKAADVSQRHEVIERFLIACLGFDNAKAHDEAERLEHVVSQKLIDSMDALQVK